jgi:hypothetical protein
MDFEDIFGNGPVFVRELATAETGELDTYTGLYMERDADFRARIKRTLAEQAVKRSEQNL